MIKINADQIKNKLGYPYYLILGSDPYLQYYAQTQIKIAFKQAGFDEQLTFYIDNQTDWHAIYDNCKSMNLFSSQTLIALDFGENSLTTAITNYLNTLGEMLVPDVALVIILNKLSKAQENAAWYKYLSSNMVVVNCATPDTTALPQWLANYLKQHNLTIDTKGIELLCYYYEGNLLALTQTLTKLNLLYPKNKITYAQIEAHIQDSAIFTPYHWIDAMVTQKVKRAVHILEQLKINDLEPLILLRVVQRELILLINLKKRSMQSDFRQAFDEYKIWQSRRQIYTHYLTQANIIALYQTLAKLTQIEINLKSDYTLPIWDNLTSFTLQFMGVKSC